jgi:mannose-6-phosphate isomerase
MLYPLKFKPILLEKIWGGTKLKTDFNKIGKCKNCGESWEISGVEGNISIIENGFLAGNNLQEIIEIYMADLLGDKVFKRFGVEFPLLIKLIHAKDDLSIQVHPDNDTAKEKHNAYGKSEMWYILDAEKDSKLISGFSKQTNKEEVKQAIKEGKLNDLLNYETVKFGDVFYIPSGRIHSIGKGIVLAEIQQSSDITYRVYDFDRFDSDGNKRELHNELAEDVLDYNFYNNYKTEYEKLPDRSNKIIECDHFSVSIISLINILERNYYEIDSFVVLICIVGSVKIKTNNGNIDLIKGETVLIPAELDRVKMIPNGYVELLEVYIP